MDGRNNLNCKLAIVGFLFILAVSKGETLFAQLRHPFPGHAIYFSGTIKPNNVSQQQMDDSVRAFYNAWKQRYINSGCDLNEYYVWFELLGKECVSEGQGYGMMIVALMAGYDTTAKTTFDGLYKYYRSHPSKKNDHLMAWAQTGDCSDVDKSSATDGDMDIAYSLLLANAQWGSGGNINYLQEANKLLADIMKEEVNHKAFSILTSNGAEDDSKDYFDMRSSDFMPAHCKAFQLATGNPDWKKVIDSNYRLFRLMQERYSQEAGLVPDFIEHIDKVPIPARPHYMESRFDGAYNYNACRVPWRIATDYILTGDPRSKAFVEKINRWIKETTQNIPDNISAGYSLGGDDLRGRYFEAMSFIGSFAVSAMVSGENQDWLNKLWAYILSFDLDQFDYYDNTIKMIEMIILSGNYWSP